MQKHTKVGQGAIIQMFMNLFVRLLVHFVMKHNLIRAVMEFFICVKKNPKAFSDTAAKICLESHIYTYTDFKKMLTKLINEKKTNRSKTLPEHKNIRGKSHFE